MISKKKPGATDSLRLDDLGVNSSENAADLKPVMIHQNSESIFQFDTELSYIPHLKEKVQSVEALAMLFENEKKRAEANSQDHKASDVFNFAHLNSESRIEKDSGQGQSREQLKPKTQAQLMQDKFQARYLQEKLGHSHTQPSDQK